MTNINDQINELNDKLNELYDQKRKQENGLLVEAYRPIIKKMLEQATEYIENYIEPIALFMQANRFAPLSMGIVTLEPHKQNVYRFGINQPMEERNEETNTKTQV